MLRHGDYAASIAISQQTFQDLLRVLYHANRIPHRLDLAALGVNVSVFLDCPTVEFHAGNGNRLALTSDGWGTLTLPAGPAAPPETREVQVRWRLLVTPDFAFVDGLLLTLDAANAELDLFTVDVVSGAPFPPASEALLDSPAGRSAIEGLLRGQLAAQSLAPPFGLSILGPLANQETSRVTTRVHDGAIVLGVDLVAPASITTQGNPDLLSNTVDLYGLATWTNPKALPFIFSDVVDQLTKRLANSGAKLSLLTITPAEGRLLLVGEATKPHVVRIIFSVTAVPRMVRPGTHVEWDEEYGEHFEHDTPPRDELWFDVTEADVEARALLGLVLPLSDLFGLGSFVVLNILGFIRNEFLRGVYQQGKSGAARVQEFTLPDVPEPPLRFTLAAYELHAEGLFAGLTLKPLFEAGRIETETRQDIGRVAQGLRLAVRLPPEVHPEDPNMRVRWTVWRRDTLAQVFRVDGPAKTHANLVVTPTEIPSLIVGPDPEHRIGCRVYRAIGGATEDFFDEFIILRVSDVLDRSHPYVWWEHDVTTPVVRKEPDGSRTILGLHVAHRTSKIHRTDFANRCRMATEFSRKVLREDMGGPQPFLQYLDALPFPQAALLANRRQVCDYCFFGGPDKSQPK